MQYALSRVFIDRYGAGWVRQSLQKLGLVVQTREQLPVIYSNFKSLLLARKLDIPDNRELKSGLENTQGYYGRGNTLSIAHPRDKFGHGDLADAVTTAVFATKIKRDSPPEHRIHYLGKGNIFVEEPVKPFCVKYEKVA
jgi:hypothetical protein